MPHSPLERTRHSCRLAAVLLLGAAPVVAQPARTDAPASQLFVVGERSEYAVRVNGIPAGSARLSVDSLVTIRGNPAYKATLALDGRVLFFSLSDRYETWIDTTARFSYRYRQQIRQTRYKADRLFEIYPDSLFFTLNGGPRQPSIAEPLDELALVLFLRTQVLEPDSTYSFDRYFRPDRNPVKLQVLRHERVNTPMGAFDCVVVRPIIKSRGMFGEDSHAEVWISTGTLRDVVQIKTKVSVFSLVMTLKDVKRAATP
jgi:hypothetical protein